MCLLAFHHMAFRRLCRAFLQLASCLWLVKRVEEVFCTALGRLSSGISATSSLVSGSLLCSFVPCVRITLLRPGGPGTSCTLSVKELPSCVQLRSLAFLAFQAERPNGPHGAHGAHGSGPFRSRSDALWRHAEPQRRLEPHLRRRACQWRQG